MKNILHTFKRLIRKLANKNAKRKSIDRKLNDLRLTLLSQNIHPLQNICWPLCGTSVFNLSPSKLNSTYTNFRVYCPCACHKLSSYTITAYWHFNNEWSYSKSIKRAITSVDFFCQFPLSLSRVICKPNFQLVLLVHFSYCWNNRNCVWIYSMEIPWYQCTKNYRIRFNME